MCIFQATLGDIITSVCWVELYILNLDVYLLSNPRRYYYLCLLGRFIYFEFRCVSFKQP